LLGHAADLVAGTAAPDDRELAVIDPHRTVFAGMVDPDHRFDVGFGRRIAGQVGRAFGSHAGAGTRDAGRRAATNTTAQIAVMTSDASRFQPASETPSSD